MPDSITFKVDAYCKLAKGETGLTQAGTPRCMASQAIDFVLNQFPENSVLIEYLDEETGAVLPCGDGEDDPGEDSDLVRMTIDWRKVPDSIRAPAIPARRR